MSDEFDMGSGAEGAINALDEIKKKIQQSMLSKMEKALGAIELDAKRNCSVDNGALRAGITHKKEITENEIIGTIGVGGPASEYSVYVHQGTGLYAINGDGRQEVPWVYRDPLTGKFYSTKGIKPNPFMQKAIDSNRSNIDKIFGESDLK